MDTNEEAKFEQFCKSFMGTLNTENMHDLNYNYEWNYFGAFATLLFKHSTELLDEEERVAFRRGFELLDTNRKRFEFAFENERIRKSIEYLVNHFMNVHVPYLKDRKRSVELREKGNKCFKIRGNEEALKFYNEAAIFAEVPRKEDDDDDDVDSSSSIYTGDELAFAIGNRSAALFHLNRLTECLADLDKTVYSLEYPLNRIHVLFSRKILCLQGLGRGNEANEFKSKCEEFIDDKIECSKSRDDMKRFIETSLKKENAIYCEERNNDITRVPASSEYRNEFQKRNDLMVHASVSLEMCYNQIQGRHVKTTKNIEPNQILMQDQPYAAVLGVPFYQHHCYQCFNLLNDVAFPCRRCTRVRYCSDQCSEISWREYHKYECFILPIIEKLSIGHLALRIVFEAGLEKVFQFADKDGSMHENWLNKKDADNYPCIASLVDHANEHTYEYMAPLTLVSLFLAFTLKKTGFATDDDLIKIGASVLKHILQVLCNTISVVSRDPSIRGANEVKMGSDGVIIGSAIYPNVSMLNHECDYTTCSEFNGKTIILRAIKSLDSGDEITFNYGPYYAKMSKRDRQAWLKRQYFFECKCRKCMDDCEGIECSFACPRCSGPLKVDTNKTNECSKCKAKNVNIKEAEEMVAAQKMLIETGRKNLEAGKLDEAEKSLLSAANILHGILFKNHYLFLHLNDTLSTCFLLQNKLNEALYHQKRCLKLCKEIFGRSSYYYAIHLVRNAKIIIEIISQNPNKRHIEMKTKAILSLRQANLIFNLPSSIAFNSTSFNIRDILEEARDLAIILTQ